MDGRPLPNALVSFIPAGEGGTAAYGRTDAQGYYQLTQGRNSDWVEVGQYTVQISTAEEDDEDEDGMTAKPEMVPAKYNVQSTLSEEVKRGSNTFNFELDSQGEILQPVEDPEDEEE